MELTSKLIIILRHKVDLNEYKSKQNIMDWLSLNLKYGRFLSFILKLININ